MSKLILKNLYLKISKRFLEIKDSDSDNLPVKLYNQNNSNEEIRKMEKKK